MFDYFGKNKIWLYNDNSCFKICIFICKHGNHLYQIVYNLSRLYRYMWCKYRNQHQFVELIIRPISTNSKKGTKIPKLIYRSVATAADADAADVEKDEHNELNSK